MSDMNCGFPALETVLRKWLKNLSSRLAPSNIQGILMLFNNHATLLDVVYLFDEQSEWLCEVTSYHKYRVDQRKAKIVGMNAIGHCSVTGDCFSCSA